MAKQTKNLVNLFYEFGILGKMQRAGFKLALVLETESLADHTVRTALIAYILAELENADPYKAAVMALIHDLGEIRIGDHHKVSARYLKTYPAEEKAFYDQTKNLPDKIKKEWRTLLKEKEGRKTLEGVIVQDADWLENAITAREHLSQGYKSTQSWINNVKKALETESAKKLLLEIEKTEPTDWWKNLKKMTYKKLPKSKLKKPKLNN
ncbi:HD domain-containing protein [Patescibacteria group bacterium]|nr:HD domain-containing protein [Patescibacteria group bacterium]